MLGRIGLYRVESPLGRGGMGEVFLAWDERLERRVAIKRIRHDDAALPAPLRDRFRREARMAARLSHAAIVQVHDLVTDGDADAIVMEYVEGVTLAERLAAGPLETEKAIRLARQIAEGLAAAHEAGLIHRDLKAENVVVTRSGQAKILDFGLACPLTRDNEPIITQHGAIIGTCHAMSPEQASGEELDERTDLFSFGVLLYQMLTGRLPFRGKNPLSTLKLVLTEQPTPLSEVRPDLPPALCLLVEQLLEKDRNQRPQSAFDVARKLERLEQGLSRMSDSVSELPTHPYPVVPGIRTLKSSGRRWRLLALVGTLFVVVAVTAYFMVAARTLQFDVRNEDFREFLLIYQRIELGPKSLGEELDNLDRITQSSPQYLDAQVLAAKVACKQFQSTRKLDYQEKAHSYLEKAQKLDPDNPLTFKAAFTVALMDEDTKTAEAALARLEEESPNDPDNLFLGYQLDDSQGRFDEAEKKLRDAIAIAPSWKKLYWLADIRAKRRRIGEARVIIEELRLKHPKRTWVKEQLGYLELTYGDPQEAEKIFEKLAASAHERRYFINLGLAQSLQRRYDEARDAFREAQAVEPKNSLVNLNLADAELNLENEGQAQILYGAVLKELAEKEAGAKLLREEEMVRAQCLARLGRVEEAKSSAAKALGRDLQANVKMYYEASLVYSVAGDRKLALEYAKEALKLGLSPYWFKVPAFASLHDEDADFQEPLKTHAPSVP